MFLWIYSSHTSFYQTYYLLQQLYMYSVHIVISPLSLRSHPLGLIGQYLCTIFLPGSTDPGHVLMGFVSLQATPPPRFKRLR